MANIWKRTVCEHKVEASILVTTRMEEGQGHTVKFQDIRSFGRKRNADEAGLQSNADDAKKSEDAAPKTPEEGSVHKDKEKEGS